ncbi:hypothetical protein [Acidithiobacillus caldus]|uniref:hypothetical protein n=1 Tax=Acidithiobacillus caldus TaxID=33059 RepID=UPI00165F0D44|nr:hypothetical protein [Acidithiobacillus caldus]WMT46566.1 MAG: hypothetical protein RE468_11825 [Acidithiobacillus caldus]
MHEAPATAQNLCEKGRNMGVAINEGQSLAFYGIRKLLHRQEEKAAILAAGKKVTTAIVVGICGK